MNVNDIYQTEKDDTLIVGKCNSKSIWLVLLIASIAVIFLALFALSRTNTVACFIFCVIAFILSFTGVLIYLRDSRVKFEVTRRFIYRRTAFGRQTYLPFDSICAVDRKWLNSVSVYTKAGKFGCILLNNKDEVFLAIKNILDERQNNI